MSEYVRDFVALANLYFQENISLGALAGAIERGGVWGWHRYGNFDHFPPGSADAQAALNRLARQYDIEHAPFAGEAPDLDPRDDLLWQYGWRESGRPDFASAAGSEPNVQARAADLRKSEKSLIATLGVVLGLLEGRHGWETHPRYTTSTDLAEYIETQLQMHGLSKRSLETRFAEARRIVDEWQY